MTEATEKKEAYTIVSNTSAERVAQMVNSKIAEGYKPLGGLVVSPAGFILQALTLK